MPTHLSNTVALLFATVASAYLVSHVGFWYALLAFIALYGITAFLSWRVNPPYQISPGFGTWAFTACYMSQFAGIATIPAATLFRAMQSRPGEGIQMYILSGVLIIVLILCGGYMSQTILDNARGPSAHE